MTNFELHNIHIKSFRGIKDYCIDFDDKSLVLVGENGSGKSSIVNAFEFLFTGQVESLKGTQAIKHDKSLVHLGDNPEDLSVTANINKLTIERKLNEEPPVNDILEDFKNGSFLLNRQKLLKFIELTPKGKYDNITSIIGFAKLDDIENTLNRTKNSFNTQLKNKTKDLEKKNAEILKIYGTEDIDETYEKINETLVKNDYDKLTPDSDLEKYLSQLSKQNFDKTKQLADIIDLFNVDIQSINLEFEDLLTEYEQATLYELKSTNNLIDILNKSSVYIENENLKECPICKNDIDNEEVLKYITDKKKELDEDENSLKNWKNKYSDFIKRLNKLNYTLKNIDKILSNFKEYEFDYSLDSFIDDLNKLADFELTISEINRNVLIDLDKEFADFKTKIQNDFDKLNDKDNYEELTKVYKVIFTLHEIEGLQNDLKIIEKEYELANTTYTLFKDNKQKTLEKILEDIQKRVSEYYNFIHDDEEFNTPEIKAPRSTGISLNLNFKDVIADPRSYSSEGHLDSLGLFVFLAFVKEFNKYNFIILDDIISTVDLNHKERIASLLLEEFKDYQIILTTHSKLWFRQLKNYAINYKLGHKFIFAEIRHLDKFTGPDLNKNMFTKELIEKYLEFGDAYAAGNAIRRYLEYVCENVCRTNQIPLPLKEHYMVDDYYKAIKKYFLDSKIFKSSPKIESYYEKVFKHFDSSRYLGNVLSHDDDSNLDVTLNEVEKFKKVVFLVERSMTCWKCGRYLSFDENKKSASCTGRKCIAVMSFKNKE